MPVVYYYIPANKLKDAVDCGLKLSEWKDRCLSTPWSNGEKPCLSALLHPMDDPKHHDPAYCCVKLDVPADYCVVCDSDLFHLSLEYPKIKKDYIRTMVPLKNYLFGSFRKPECLVFTTVLSEQINLLGKGMDDPILYESSERLYVNNLLQKYNDWYDEINRVLLYSFLKLQEQNEVMRGFRSEKKGIAVFFDQSSNQHISVPIPDFKKYRLQR